jgi:hypothetical protein
MAKKKPAQEESISQLVERALEESKLEEPKQEIKVETDLEKHPKFSKFKGEK